MRVFLQTEFATSLRVHRAKLDITLRQATSQCSVGTATLSRIESCVQPPSVEDYGKLCAWMGKPETEFYGDGNE